MIFLNELLARKNLVSFLYFLSKGVIRDSYAFYFYNFLISIFILTILLSCNLPTVVIAKSFIENTTNIFSIIPPFTLAIICLFPSFSESTKKALSKRAIDYNDDRSLGAVFLTDFLYVTVISTLFLLLSLSVQTLGAFAPKNYLPQLCSILLWILYLIGTSVVFEAFKSLKLLFLLIIREYEEIHTHQQSSCNNDNEVQQ